MNGFLVNGTRVTITPAPCNLYVLTANLKDEETRLLLMSCAEMLGAMIESDASASASGVFRANITSDTYTHVLPLRLPDWKAQNGITD